MRQQMPSTSLAARPFPPRTRNAFVTVLGVGLTAAMLAAAIPASLPAAARQPQHQPLAASIPVSPAKLSDHEIEELATMRPQQQAERLVERAVNHYAGALELIDRYIESWYGQLDLQGRLSGSLNTAMNSNDLRVRGAALDIYLAGYSLSKRSETAETLIRQIQDEPASRPWALFMLGALGNRGIETYRAFTTLMDYRHDPNEQTRFWAIEGLAALGIDETLAPLLDTFRTDPSPAIRERGACSLAQSGMLTREQRLRAVPELLRMMDDPTLDATTRTWVFQALRDITGTGIGPDPATWRNWWSQHGQS
jgi:HEAT repeat protein